MACFKKCCSGDCTIDTDKLIAGGIIAAGAVFSFMGISRYMKAAKLKKKAEEPFDDEAEYEKYKEKKQRKREKKIRKNIISGICCTFMAAVATTVGILYLTPVKDKVLESDAVGRLKELELPKVDFSKVDVSRIKEIELPKVDFSKVDVSKIKEIELPKVDVSRFKNFELPKVNVSRIKEIEIPKVDLSRLEALEAIKKLEAAIDSLKKSL